MRSKPSLTPVLGTALAAVAAGSLLAFSVVAQQAGLVDIALPRPVPATRPGASLGGITLPGAPSNPAAPRSSGPATTAPSPTLVASAPAPTPEAAPPTLAPEVPAPSEAEPSFEGLDDGRRPASTARVGDGDLERGWRKVGHGRGAEKHDRSSAVKKGGSNERSAPPGHARKSGTPAREHDRHHGPPSTPPGHATQKARAHGRDEAPGHAKDKGHAKHDKR